MEPSINKLGILSLQFFCFPDEIGGAWKYTYEVNKRFARRGHDVVLITCKPNQDLPDYEVIDGIHYYRIEAQDSKNFFFLCGKLRQKLKLIFKRHCISLVHSHNPLIEFAALFSLRLNRLPKVYHFHSLWYDEEKINRMSIGKTGFQPTWSTSLKLKVLLNCIGLIEWACFFSAHRVLFLSQYSMSRFEKFYPLSHPGLKVIPGGVDTDAFRPGASGMSLRDCRRELSLPQDIPVIITVRRLAARMGLENLVSACGLIAQRQPDLKFFLVIVGKGDLYDRLNDQIRNLGLKDRVKLAGPILGEALHRYHDAANAFVLPTTAIEGFGLATVEALSSGLPVLGTPVGGTVEILKAIDPRMLFDGTSPKALADGIESFLKNLDSFQELKEKCRQETKKKYDWEQVVDQLEKEFYNVLKTS